MVTGNMGHEEQEEVLKDGKFCNTGYEDFATWQKLWKILTFQRFQMTSNKWISHISLFTSTDGNMVINTAVCIQTTRSWAWILAFFINTCFIARAVSINDTFRSTIWRKSHISLQAWTWWIASSVSTLREWSTRRWDTWIYWCRRCFCNNFGNKNLMSVRSKID